MHAILYGIKRAHLRSLAVCREMAIPLGLTPARFDLLHAIQKQPCKCLLQSYLRRLLGVSAPTISRMLKSLEQLGIIRRAVVPEDRRQREVSLTEEGARCFDVADRMTVGVGALDLALDCALGFPWRASSQTSAELFTFESTLGTIRAAFRDTAAPIYAWHPDD